MTFLFKTGTFTSRTTTGTDVISGVGFQPKVIILWAAVEATNDDTFADLYHLNFGAAVDTTAANQKSIWIHNFDFDTGNTFTQREWHAASIISGANTNAVINLVGVISAIGADGFTVNWTTNTNVAKRINYICIGGTDITNTDTGQFTTPTAGTTGNQGYTGVGFQPDFVMFWGVGLTTDSSSDYGLNFGLGFATASTQACISGMSRDAVATTDSARYQRGSNTNCYALLSLTSSSTKVLEGSLTSMDSDGFTINWTTVGAGGASVKVGYLAMKGGSYQVGSITAPAAGTPPISQPTTGVGFLPSGLLMASVNATTASTITATNRISIGGGSAADVRSSWAGDTDAQGTASILARIHKSAKIISLITENATPASSTVNAEAAVTSLDADGFTLSWTTANLTAYEILYIAMGAAGAPPAAPAFRLYHSFTDRGFIPAIASVTF